MILRAPTPLFATHGAHAQPRRGVRGCALCILGALFAAYLAACCVFYVAAAGGGSIGGASHVGVPRGLRTPEGDAATAEAEAEATVRAELGRGAWNLLHRMAAQFDKEPTPESTARAVAFFTSLGDLYPCEDCASHYRTLLAARPVDASSNAALSLWLCATHNDVNARLGKPAFPCTLEAIKEKWGSCGCFGNATETADSERGVLDGRAEGSVVAR